MNGSSLSGRLSDGFILVPRAWLQEELWRKDPHYLRFWLYLYFRARWDERPHYIFGILVRRGQVLKSYQRICEENPWLENRAEKTWKKSRIGRMVSWYKKLGWLDTEETEHGTLFTLTDYCYTQDSESYKVGLGTEPGTEAGRSGDKRKKGKNGNNPPSRPSLPDWRESFEEWWVRYPRKVEKEKAFQAWKDRLQEGVSVGELSQGLERYRDHLDRQQIQEQFMKFPANFLGPGEVWKEEYREKPSGSHHAREGRLDPKFKEVWEAPDPPPRPPPRPEDLGDGPMAKRVNEIIYGGNGSRP